MVLAVASIGTVGFFADRVKGALSKQANLLLGADVLISGDRPLPETFAAEAAARGLVATPVLEVQQHGAARGRGDVRRRRGARGRQGGGSRLSVARRDHCWSIPRSPAGRRRKEFHRAARPGPTRATAARLDIEVGDTLAVGDAALKVGAIVQQEPEVASGLLAIGPRLLIHIDDVPATNLLQPGNRASHRLLVADLAARNALVPYLEWLQAELKPGQRMENIRDLRPEVRQTLERAEQFLGLPRWSR